MTGLCTSNYVETQLSCRSVKDAQARISIFSDNEVVFRRDVHDSILGIGKAQRQWLEFLLDVKHRFECLLPFPAQRQLRI